MRNVIVTFCIGLLLALSQPTWGDGGEGEAESFKDTIRAMQERIKELENEVRQLKNAPPPAPVAASDTSGLEKRLDYLEGLSILKGIEIHGLIAADYTYSLNRPKSKVNTPILFNQNDNTFSLNQANIQISKSADSGLGFLADVDFGETAEIVGSATRWSNNPNSTESNNSIELRQAYATYKFSIGNGVTLKAGKFVTPFGAEVIKSWNNFNYNISNSILFGYAIPFTHTGVLGNYSFNDYVGLDLGFVNGWDAVADNNSGKTVLAALTLKPHEKFTVFTGGSYGPEQNDRSGSKRALISTVATYKMLDNLTFMLEHDYGHETDVVANSSGALTKNADWHGVAGYAIFSLTDKLSFALRGEYFGDPDGVRTGLKQDLWEVTPTVWYTIAEGFLARFEYRHNNSSKDYFQGHTTDGFSTGQDVFASELIYGF
jgi:hypothetical protein